MTVAGQITDEQIAEWLAYEGDLALHAAVGPFAMRALLTELQHRREAEAGAVAFIPQADLDRLARTGLSDCRLYREPTGSRFVVPLFAASPSSPASGVRVKAPTFAELKRDAENAVDALTAYAHNNEALEDACGESAKAMVAATWNRVKAEQALTAIRDMTFKSAPALSALGEHP